MKKPPKDDPRCIAMLNAIAAILNVPPDVIPKAIEQRAQTAMGRMHTSRVDADLAMLSAVLDRHPTASEIISCIEISLQSDLRWDGSAWISVLDEQEISRMDDGSCG